MLARTAPQDLYHKVYTPIKKKTICFLDKNTDLLSSAGIFAITTCLLAAKIFKNMPPLLSRIAKVVYDFGGIIWLNIQIKDFIKSCKDLNRVASCKQWNVLVPVAAKVFVKGINILMTIAIFSGSVIAACGYPQLMMAMLLSTRTVNLSAFFTGIGTDIYDYYKNNSLIQELKNVDDNEAPLVVKHFHATITAQQIDTDRSSKPYRIAQSLVRQLDMHTIEMYKEIGAEKITKEKLQPAIVSKNTGTKANLGLITLGYATMGISKAYPNTLADMSVRWGMSALYTGELVRQKVFLHYQRKN
jgi:hypothetical protein